MRPSNHASRKNDPGKASPLREGKTVQIALHASAGTLTGTECVGFNGLPGGVLRVIIEEGRIPLLAKEGSTPGSTITIQNDTSLTVRPTES